MMTQRALQTRRAYAKAWRMKNKDKIRGYNEKYWDKKGQKEDGKEDNLK